MAEDFTGKHVVVTGAARGIGAAVAARFAAAGATVTLMGRSLAPLQAEAERCGGHAIACDITDEASVREAFAAAAARAPVDILVNNAGAVETAPFLKSDAALLQRMLAVNLNGAWYCTQAVLPAMLQRGHGRIVNVASTAGIKAYPYVSAYVAAKHALVGLTKSLALEVATGKTGATGVTVNAVCPGYTDTDLVRDAAQLIAAKTGRGADDAVASFAKSNPQGRLIRPEEVAATVAFLAQDESASINGAILPIAGGEV